MKRKPITNNKTNLAITKRMERSKVRFDKLHDAVEAAVPKHIVDTSQVHSLSVDMIAHDIITNETRQLEELVQLPSTDPLKEDHFANLLLGTGKEVSQATK